MLGSRRPPCCRGWKFGISSHGSQLWCHRVCGCFWHPWFAEQTRAGTRIQDLCPRLHGVKAGKDPAELRRRESWRRDSSGRLPRGCASAGSSESEPELASGRGKSGTWWQNHTTASLDFTFSCNPERKGIISQEKGRIHTSLRQKPASLLGCPAHFPPLKYIPSNRKCGCLEHTHRARSSPAQTQHMNHGSTFTTAVPKQHQDTQSPRENPDFTAQQPERRDTARSSITVPPIGSGHPWEHGTRSTDLRSSPKKRDPERCPSSPAIHAPQGGSGGREVTVGV